MKILGITAEYDPFHNGHEYHLGAAKEAVCPEATICAMSGDITQRGELAVLDKWKRARIAVDRGVDLVLELPFLYACSPASNFACGAVDMLLAAGATHISFGCEAEEPSELLKLARLQISEAAAVEEAAREEMKSGLSYVKARARASNRIIGEGLTRLSLTPNNILALEYLKRMIFWQEQGMNVEPVPVVRKGSGYTETSRGYAGGSAIRTMIEAGWNVDEFLPYDVKDYVDSGSGWIDLESARSEMLKQLKGIVLRTAAEELGQIRFIGEGIENRLIREITDAENYEGLLKRMTSKRYTTSTIRRMLICILLGVRKEAAEAAAGGGSGESCPAPLYGRVLAMDNEGRRLIASQKDDEDPLPFIVNVNRTDGLMEAAKNSLELDILAADLYNLLTGRDAGKHTDHRQKPYVR